MLFLNLGFLFLILTGLICCLKSPRDWMKEIDKKEHKLYLLYPFADWIMKKSGIDKILAGKKEVVNSLRALYTDGKPEIIYKIFWCRRVSMLLAILILLNLLSFISLLAKDSSLLINGKYIERPGYGEGSTKAELNVTVENSAADGMDPEKTPEPFNLTVNIDEKGYIQAELDQIFQKSFEYLQKMVLGENASADAVYYNLNFIKSIPGTSIKVDWYPKDYDLIQSDGSIINDNLSQEGVQTSVTAQLSYGKQQRKQQSMIFRIMPRRFTKEELLKEKLEKEISASSEETLTDSYLKLPDTLENYRLVWSENKKESRLVLFFLGVILSVIIWIFGDKELDKKMKERKEQMLIDYPEIINKFTLLINAGMTIKQAWMKITEDYGSAKSRNRAKRRYAYEEMLITAHELNLGISEYNVYEQFGRRTGLIPYIKFSSFITQNLKKGTKGFTGLLMQEAAQAFEERKEIAKRLGEEAGTKLLIPMMVMLITIFLIIMIPAFLSFRLS